MTAPKVERRHELAADGAIGWLLTSIDPDIGNQLHAHVALAIAKAESAPPAEAKTEGDWVACVPRASVRWFAEQMELKLRENDHKGGWHECSRHSLMARVLEESAELIEATNPAKHNRSDFYCAARNARFAANMVAAGGFFTETKDLGSAVAEAVDVANMAMMVADHFREDGPSQDQGQTLSTPKPPEAR